MVVAFKMRQKPWGLAAWDIVNDEHTAVLM